MNWKEILGDEIEKYGEVKFSKIEEYHYYLPIIYDNSEHEIRNNKIYLDGKFSSEQLEAFAEYIREKIRE